MRFFDSIYSPLILLPFVNTIILIVAWDRKLKSNHLFHSLANQWFQLWQLVADIVLCNRGLVYRKKYFEARQYKFQEMDQRPMWPGAGHVSLQGALAKQ